MRKINLAPLALGFALGSAVLIAAPGASGTLTAAATSTEVVTATEAVNVRVAPNLSGEVIAQMSPDRLTNIRCGIAGQWLWDTNVWFYSDLPNGERGFWTAYYSDAEYNTWNDLATRYGIERCERAEGGPGGSVYYQPRYAVGDPLAPTSVYTATKDFWSAGGCSSARSSYWPAYFDGQLVTRASAWSLGRLGISYLLESAPTRAEHLKEIVLFDPGNLAEYGDNPCDLAYEQDSLIANWLAGDPERRLLVLAGAVTRDVANPSDTGQLHQGLQQFLFPAVRSMGVADQVLVCNYDLMGHMEVMRRFGHLAGSGSVASCPGSPDASWSPGAPAANACLTDFHPDIEVTFGGYSDSQPDLVVPPGERTTITVDVRWPANRLDFTHCRDRATAEISLLMGVANGRHGLTEMKHRSWEGDLPSLYTDVSTQNSNGHEMSFGTADASAIEPGRWYSVTLVLDGELGNDEILDVQMSRGYRWSGCPSGGGAGSAWCVSGWTRDDIYGVEYSPLLVDQVRPHYFQTIHGQPT